MASLTKNTQLVPIITQQGVQTGVTLSLSNQEAVALLFVLNHVGGCSATSPRGYIKSIYNQLVQVFPKTTGYNLMNRNDGIIFKDDTNTILNEYLKSQGLTI